MEMKEGSCSVVLNTLNKHWMSFLEPKYGTVSNTKGSVAIAEGCANNNAANSMRVKCVWLLEQRWHSSMKEDNDACSNTVSLVPRNCENIRVQ